MIHASFQEVTTISKGGTGPPIWHGISGKISGDLRLRWLPLFEPREQLTPTPTPKNMADMMPEPSRPEGVEEWFRRVPHLLLEDGWEVAMKRPHAKLSHCGCPWGGRLIKVDLEDVRIENAPEKTGKIIVRPEVRAAFQSRSPLCGTKMTLERFICPGEAVLKGLTSTKLFRLCAVLFGEMSAGTSSSFCFHDAHFPVALHHKIRRDYPKEGNSATAFWEETGSLRQEGIFLIQPSGTEKLFFATAVVRLPHDKFASWATFQFRTFLTLAHRTCNWLLNRPGIVQLRAADESFYVILQIQSFQRGFPLVPVFDEERAIVTIDAGEALGFRYWTRFQSERFHLRQYLKCFLAAIGQEIEIFDTLDSRRLVPYQCVVCRSQWEAIRARFLDIFRLAKTAYRRANGGTVAPGMQDGVEPRFVPEFHHAMQEGQKRPEAQLVVRNTFLDLQEEEDREMSEMSARPLRRPRTTQF